MAAIQFKLSSSYLKQRRTNSNHRLDLHDDSPPFGEGDRSGSASGKKKS